MTINIMSSKDTGETRTLHSKRDKIEIMIGNETNEIIGKTFDFILQKYQKDLEKSMKGSKFVFNSVDLLHYKCHKKSLNRGGLYVDSPKWLKIKTATISPINKKDNNCFQYTVTVALNHTNIVKDP